MTARLSFDRGTLLLEDGDPALVPEGFIHDPRVGILRAPAMCYHEVVMAYHRTGAELRDDARAYELLDREHKSDRTPRDYQTEAVSAWQGSGRRGTVVLPTGTGKSLVAELCIADSMRSTLVIAPTLDLVGQWYDVLIRAFGQPIGILGGGYHDVHPLTVTTYDSAYLHMERIGAQFGLLVFDEVHHLPSRAYASAAHCSIAPFRLGLTATLERTDGAHVQVDHLIGPVVYRQEITDLAGEFLAPYRTEILEVHLSDDDADAYATARETYREFVRSKGIRMGGPGGWRNFLRQSARSTEGRQAFRAWRESREILQAAPQKLLLLAELLRRHQNRRILVFTNDNATVYEISRRLLVPAITHQTELKERRQLLAAFEAGTLPVLVTSRVLNEGVDIPVADIAIVLSGTSTVREHVQRLGRILRPREGKQALLYEILVADTTEQHASRRRRAHPAYDGAERS